MKVLEIKSKKYGNLEVLLDNDDYKKLENEFDNMNWCVSKNRKGLYAQKRVNKKIIYLHRYIMNFPNGVVDHINHNTLDNRKNNLRITSNANNLRNGTVRTNNKSGITGVSYDKKRKKYVSSIKVYYKNINLGRFDTIEEAIKVRKNAEVKYWAVKGDDEYDIPRV